MYVYKIYNINYIMWQDKNVLEALLWYKMYFLLYLYKYP